MDFRSQVISCFSAYPFGVSRFSAHGGGDWLHVADRKKLKMQSFKGFFMYANFLFLFQLLICAVQPVSSQDWDGIIITQSDYQALQAFKHDLVDPKGFLKSWNDSGYGACSGGWLGIKCAQGQVIVIQLPWRGLSGKITEKIGQFQALRKLSLHDNSIGGSIPISIGFLPNLRGVQLFNNRLSGSIPASFGLCPVLQTLDLGNNSLSGTIPSSLANSTKLFRLNLSYNSLTGSIPFSLTQLPSLIYLALDHNNLSGPIPNSWGGNGTGLYRVQFLTLDHNSFSGNIPVSLGKLSELREVSFAHNQISGVIPDDLGRLSRLERLDLSYNAINGSLPHGFFNLSSLAFLNLENNSIDGQIPEFINKLRNLSVFNLRNNHFGGQIPVTIGNISVLNQLDFSYNNLSGEIPLSLSDLPNLTSFNVSYNHLSGPVPSGLSRKFNSSSFVGNIQLCGYSASTPCPVAPSPGGPAAPTEEVPGKRHRKLSTKDIILVAAGALLIVLLIICCILCCCLIKKRSAAEASKDGQRERATAGRAEKGVPPSASEVEAAGETGGKLVHFDGPIVFTADDLLCATAEIMGKSTYGTVYKATLEDGNQVAVKRLREKITKGQKEFEAEANILGKIRHQNLLALRAYYLGPKGEKLLVFDYMPRGSLATFLHARSPDTPIDWPTRMKIIKGMTRGLLYLHTSEKMIHGNLTSSNVLLDEHTNAKISDYGLSRLMTAAANANVIATAGALGYRAPELSKLKKANTKTDVYSLGVIVLELLTGKSPGEAMNGAADLPQWVASIVKEEWTNEVFDVELMRDATEIGDELLNTLKLALFCVDPSPSARPEVQQVLQQLEEIRPETAASSGDEGAAATAPSASH